MSGFDQKRTESNQKLLDLLGEVLKENPSLRFSQALLAFGFVNESSVESSKYWVNEFYKEPEFVLDRVKEAIKNK